MNSSEIKIYQVEGDQTEIEVKLRDEMDFPGANFTGNS